MVDYYMKMENTIIMVVLPGTENMEKCDAKGLTRKKHIDPIGERTLLVRTKCDLLI